MEWHKLVIGRRVRAQLPSGVAGGYVEVTGQLLGRDTAKFIEWGRSRESEFRAVVRLDDGTILLVELASIVGRADD